MSRILVTGAAGFIGSHTVDVLLAEGATVLGVDDLSTGRTENLAGAAGSPSFSLEVIDVSEDSVFGAAVEKFRPDSIVHLAALVGAPLAEEDPRKNHRINLHGTHNVAEAARVCGTKRLVYASSAAVYGNVTDFRVPLCEDDPAVPLGQYGASKYAGEIVLGGYAASYGLSPVCFRYFNVFGPRQDFRSTYSGVVSIFLDKARAGEAPLIFGDGNQSRDFIYVGDVALGNARAALELDLPAGIFNRCTGVSTTLLDLLATLKSEFPDLPDANFAEERAGDIRHSLGDPTKASEHLGIASEVSFTEGIKELIESA